MMQDDAQPGRIGSLADLQALITRANQHCLLCGASHVLLALQGFWRPADPLAQFAATCVAEQAGLPVGPDETAIIGYAVCIRCLGQYLDHDRLNRDCVQTLQASIERAAVPSVDEPDTHTGKGPTDAS